jgi:hypothetical protein
MRIPRGDSYRIDGRQFFGQLANRSQLRRPCSSQKIREFDGPGRPDAGENPQQAAEELRQAAANRNILLLPNRQGKSPVCGPVGGSYRVNHAAPLITRSKKYGPPSVAPNEPTVVVRCEVPRAD